MIETSPNLHHHPTIATSVWSSLGEISKYQSEGVTIFQLSVPNIKGLRKFNKLEINTIYLRKMFQLFPEKKFYQHFPKAT